MLNKCEVNKVEQTEEIACTEVVGWARVLQHAKEPQNLIVYLVLTAWMKFMGVAEHIPSITIG
jgi:O-acetyl-ADP-ribose deacetylase (regulator of RNase III)